MNDGVMKKFLRRHKFAEIGVPFGRVIHSASPFLLFDRSGFFQKRSMDAVKQFPNPLAGKDPALHPSAMRIEPIKWSGSDVQQPSQWF